MTIHELKIWPQYYHAVAGGSKTFEVRKNDRGYQKGDRVTLRCFDPVEERYNYSLQMLEFEVGYVLPIDAERVVFSLIPVGPHDQIPSESTHTEGCGDD